MSVFSFTFNCRLRAVKDLMIQTQPTYKMGQREMGQGIYLFIRRFYSSYTNTKKTFHVARPLVPKDQGCFI